MVSRIALKASLSAIKLVVAWTRGLAGILAQRSCGLQEFQYLSSELWSVSYRHQGGRSDEGLSFPDPRIFVRATYVLCLYVGMTGSRLHLIDFDPAKEFTGGHYVSISCTGM